MYQQPLTHTLTTEALFRTLHCPAHSPAEDDRKLGFRDMLMMAAQVAVVLVICWGLHSAFA